MTHTTSAPAANTAATNARSAATMTTTPIALTAPRPPAARTLARTPTLPTLKKYGLDEESWRAMLEAQGNGCAICGKVPPSGTRQIDHAHVEGWKNMLPVDRRQYIRGILCWFDNSVMVRRGATPERLRAAADYLVRYERGRDASTSD